MNKCRKCQNTLRPTAKFCPRCGEPVSLMDKPRADWTIRDSISVGFQVAKWIILIMTLIALVVCGVLAGCAVIAGGAMWGGYNSVSTILPFCAYCASI